MWVAMITEPATQGEERLQFEALRQRFPAYDFTIMMADPPYIIARPKSETVQFPEDESTEVEMLRFIVTSLIDELLTGHSIIDDQELDAPPRR